MPYTITAPNQLVYFGSVWADPVALHNTCTEAYGNQFQTQAARTAIQQQINGQFKTVPTRTVRFSDGDMGFRCYRYDSTLDPLITALLNACDTRNRIIETEKPTNPNTTEVINATQRIDDATVNIRSSLSNLMNELVKGTGSLNTASFEASSGLVWTATANT
nr:coat protein [Capsicum mild mottle virus]